MKRTRTRRRHAFTLIEMIVATLVLAIGVVGALAAFNMATRASNFAADVQTATLLAQQHLADIELQPDQLTGGDQEGDFDDHPGYHWKQSIETTDYPDLYKVTVTVQWGASNPPQERSAVTYLRNPANALDTSATTGSNTGTGQGGGAGGSSAP